MIQPGAEGVWFEQKVAGRKAELDRLPGDEGGHVHFLELLEK